MFILSPILATIAILATTAYIYRNRGKEEYKQLLIITGVATIIIGCIVSGTSYYVGTSHTKYKEIWNFRIDYVEYWEKWTEKEQRSRKVPNGTERYISGTDSKGRSKYSTRTKYKTEYYYVTVTKGPYWYKIDEYQTKSRISAGEYEKWKNIWANQKHIKTNQGSATGFNRAITGNVYQCTWTNQIETLYPVTAIKIYENKVRATKNTFNLAEPTEKELKRFPRPADKGQTSPVLTYGGPKLSSEEILAIQRSNAIMGPVHQIHTMLVIFKAEEGRGITDSVMNAWQGPNKNELIVFVGLDKRTVKWIDVESWIDDTMLHVIIENDWLNKEMNGKEYAEYLRKVVPKNWIRKKFNEDFEYLQIEPTMGSKFACFILCFLLSGGVCVGVFFMDKKQKENIFR